MHTQLTDALKDTPEGKEAAALVRACVHCGFCLATCPTYQLLGDELDSPRGRIYLIKQALEGQPVTAKTQLHLDRCLNCRACETTCPSGVQYGRLLDIGRAVVDRQVRRPLEQRYRRAVLNRLLPRHRLLRLVLTPARWLKPLLPGPLRQLIPVPPPPTAWPETGHNRRMILLDGCTQAALAPNINAAAARVLARLGIAVLRPGAAGCCGALSHHLNYQEDSLGYIRRNIDAWWPALEQGAEAVVITASGCGVTVKEYGRLLQHDPAYAHKAAKVALLSRDISEVLHLERDALITPLHHHAQPARVAFHSPCSLQHGQHLRGLVEPLLQAAGFELTPVTDAHFCCGAAGPYALLQRSLSLRLRAGKLQALQAGNPDWIATANIGCLSHLQAGSSLPVRHWIELIDAVLAGTLQRPGTTGGRG